MFKNQKFLRKLVFIKAGKNIQNVKPQKIFNLNQLEERFDLSLLTLSIFKVKRLNYFVEVLYCSFDIFSIMIERIS